MSLLTSPLPKTVVLGVEEIPVAWDHRTMLQINELLSTERSEEEKGMAMLTLFYGDLPKDIEAATEAMLWFFRGGTNLPDGSEPAEGKPISPDFSYQQDAGLIYAAFLTQYQIDLTEDTLHWWQFRALFDALQTHHLFSEVRKCRSMKIQKEMPPEQKQYYRHMKQRYALFRPAREQSAVDAITAALLGDGDVMGVLHAEEN